MPSSLASQLQNIASVDASRLTSRYGQPSSKSYLFPPKVAEAQDLDAVFALAQSGFDELLHLDPEIEEFERELFSEAAKRTDRMMLNKEENDKLDETLARCLRRLGKWVGIMAGGKCIEWLVRRFRVHEFNTEVLLQAFLPYHDSPNFARILAILSLPTSSPYSAPFAPLVKAAQQVPREYITTAVSSARDPSLRLLTDVAESVKTAVDEKTVHRALLAFWTATLVDLLERSRSSSGRISEGVVKVLVETFVTLLSTPNAGPEVNAAVYPPLVLLTRTVHLSDPAFLAVIESLLTPNSGANPPQRLLTLLVILDQRKGWEGGLGDDAAARLAKIPQIGDLLVAAIDKYGFVEATKSVVGALLEDVALSQETLTKLVDYPTLATPVVEIAVAKLLETPAEVHSIARPLLSTLRQRHPNLTDAAVLEASSSSPVDSALVQWTSAESAFIDVHSADVASRVSGVKEMYAVAEAAGLNSSNAAQLLGDSADEALRSVQTAILARLRDTDAAVLTALYAESDLLLALLTGVDYIEAVTPAFVASNPVREALGLHLAFLGASYIPAHSEIKNKVFEKLLIPNLLATEERRAFGPEQWTSVVKASRLLDRVQSIVAIDASRDELVKFNQDLIKSLTRGIASSGDIGVHVDALIANLSMALPAARLLASLTLAELVTSAGGYQHVVAARSLTALQSYLTGKQMRDIEQVETPLATDLIKAVVSKPALAKTQQRAYLALLTSAVSLKEAAEAQTNWLNDVAEESTEAQTRVITHSLYRWANSANLSAAVSRHLLQAVLSQLGEDALIFLASVWTSPVESSLRVAALRHATAFVKAYSNNAKATDFQVIIPATLVTLQDSAKPVREATAALLRAIAATPQSGSADIYGLDAIYGSRSDLVQLLKPSDLTKYLEALIKALDDMVIDAGRLASVHASVLDSQKKDKKEVTHRRDVVDWLMSHVLGWRSDTPRRSLLSSLARVANVSRLYGSIPLLTSLAASDKDEASWLSTLPATHRKEYLELAFGSFAARHVSALNENNSEAWKFLLELVTSAPTPVTLELRAISLARLTSGLFPALRSPLKSAYVEALIHSLHSLSPEDNLISKAALAKLVLAPAEIVTVLEALLEPFESQVHRKKVKTDEGEDKTEQAVADLTVFIESRDWKALTGDAPVVASLMGVLATVLSKRQAIKEGVDYLEQEILGAILAQIEQITDAGEILRARVGIEVIVKTIRASSNPRTAQRALLVASELARLIPETVLHNVMPIFTFMGSSDLQRDDAFSFGVVEKTVERIVPVMAASLKDKADSKLDLYTESRTFLAIFTDMAARLPKHRTLPFFVHLVKSLGAEDFLAPVAMLLAERGGKGKNAASGSLELSLSLASAFPPALRTEVTLDIVQEVARIINDLSDSSSSGDEDEGTSFLANGEPSTRQASVLLHLASGITKQLVGRVTPQPVVEEIVSALITLAASPAVTEEVADQLDTTLSGAMQLLAVGSFLDITARILESGNVTDISRALDLFATRLPLIKPELRGKSATAMGTIIRRTAALLEERGAATASALAALGRVVSTAIKSEDSALAAITPVVVAASKEGDFIEESVSLLAALVRHLGSRAIPFIQSVLDVCLAIARNSASSPIAVEAAFATIATLVDTVPTFVSSKQLVTVLGAAADYRATDEAASSSLITAIAKRIPTKTLIPVVMELWKSIQSAPASSIEAFFYLLRQTLRHGDSKAIPSHTKPLFAFFLEVFDIRHKAGARMAPEAVDAAETSAISSFLELVIKLSEAAFKPLFVRLYDWAVVDLSAPASDAHVVARRKILLRVMDGLLAKFRHLLTPYMGTLMPFVEELLAAYSIGEVEDESLWALLLGVLAHSMDVDDGAFWTDATLLKLLPLVVEQLALFPSVTATPESPAAKALAAMAATTSSEATLKKVNSAICLATRAEEPKARMAALYALDAAWERHSDELIQFVPETVAEFLAELLEDENSEVEGLARKVLARIEGVTGSLKEYLE
ncbi:snoRNA-binding rRNA-processing protein utp10 [Vanrija albida]|uniref:U3 small nucleolar RNA-associated protein 10 n=1 Tax=Vanrija albida TaxID=181172 RepID=A0ABR3QCU0_9TREE